MSIRAGSAVTLTALPLDARQKLLADLEGQVGGPVVACVTGDRPGLGTQIAADQIPRLPRHLDATGRVDRLGLLLYTRGGDTNTAWPFVNFVREPCKELVVLVPFYAHSAGTLIALGADRIMMSRFATLSPIDPNVANPFNPPDPSNPQAKLPIAVEDVMAYFKLAKRQGVKRDEDYAAVFSRLAESVHPLALGNVQRSIEQIRQLAEKMVRLHPPDREKEELDELIHQLTTAFYTHSHLISRREAGEIGLPVESASAAIEDLLVGYYDELRIDLELLSKFDPATLLTQSAPSAQAPAAPPRVPVRLERGYIETKTTSDAFVTEGIVSMQPAQVPLAGPQQQPPPTLPNLATLEITQEGWVELA